MDAATASSATQIALEVKGAGVETPTPTRQQSAFTEKGMAQTIDAHKAEIQKLYREGVPLVVGWSGGKD